MLSHIYTGVHLHVREETRPMDGWVIWVRKLHLGRVKDGGVMLLHTAAACGALGLRVTCTHSSVSVSRVSGGTIILQTSSWHIIAKQTEIQWNNKNSCYL